MSKATVNHPTSCSRCAMHSAASLDCLSLETNRDATFSTTCCFHLESGSSLRLCRRHSSACEVSPLSASRTTSALNSGVKVLRFRWVLHRILLSVRVLVYHNLGLESGPNFRWQYIVDSNVRSCHTNHPKIKPDIQKPDINTTQEGIGKMKNIDCIKHNFAKKNRGTTHFTTYSFCVQNPKRDKTQIQT